MTEPKVEKILKALREKLLSDKVPDDATGKIIVNLQTGGVSNSPKLELTL